MSQISKFVYNSMSKLLAIPINKLQDTGEFCYNNVRSFIVQLSFHGSDGCERHDQDSSVVSTTYFNSCILPTERVVSVKRCSIP